MALEGNLLDMSLVDLFQIFRMGPKTGVLELSTGAERGIVYVGEGRLLDAVLVRGPESKKIADGEDAVLQMLQWEQANFVFSHDKTVLERRQLIVHDSEWLILEGLRRRKYPLSVLAHEHITTDTCLALALQPGSAESGVNLDLDQWRILSQIAISENLGEICEKIAMPPDKAIRLVTELVAIGLVEVLYTPSVVLGGQAAPPIAQPGAAPLLSNGRGPSSASGRGLLRAIMRRVRGI
jgi:hypothetical protein